MKIGYVKMIGFRNFGAATVNFAEKTLIIGANDVGKSNLLHALRMVLDSVETREVGGKIVREILTRLLQVT